MFWIKSVEIRHCKEEEVDTVGRDRQEKKLRESGRVESDRDVGLRYKGATKMSSPEEARKLNDGHK